MRDPANPNRLPLNTLQHARQLALADHNSRWLTAPNNDTLYSSANLDLRSPLCHWRQDARTKAERR
jgi:hypothetical protein